MLNRRTFQPKRGDLIHISINNVLLERIFVQKIEGARCPYVVVAEDSELNFKLGQPFHIEVVEKIFKWTSLVKLPHLTELLKNNKNIEVI